jgi:hypothetical protein
MELPGNVHENQLTHSTPSLLPLMVTTYMLQYLDKVTLGYAAVIGLQKDTVRSSEMLLGIKLTNESISWGSNTPGQAVLSTSDTSLLVFQAQSASSNFQLLSIWLPQFCFGQLS